MQIRRNAVPSALGGGPAASGRCVRHGRAAPGSNAARYAPAPRAGGPAPRRFAGVLGAGGGAALRRGLMGLAAAAALAVPVAGSAGQASADRLEIMVTGAEASALRRADELVDARMRNDELVLASRTRDRYLPGRVHEGLAQYHGGVPVLGGGVSRQLADGVTVSIFGTLHEGIDVDTAPRVPADEALALVAARAGAGPAAAGPPSLVILPTLAGDYVLAWRTPMADRLTWYLDAHSGRIVHTESNTFEQSASVGVGAGIRGQRKKLSTSEGGGQYQAYDRLRPAEIVTLDMRHDVERADFLIEEPAGVWSPADVAADADNDWEDTAVVDAHAYAGFTYDYLALRQDWNGMDGRNGRLMSMVNIGLDFANAFFIRPPYGPEGTGLVAFGHEPDGTPIVAADIVAHEIMHGVTYFSVSGRTGEGLGGFWRFPGPPEFTLEGGFTPRCGESYRYADDAPPFFAGRAFHFACSDEGLLWLYSSPGGAVNEAYSDIVGTAVEFMLHEPAAGPLRADYLVGEDTGEYFRSMADPGSLLLSSRSDIPYPDAYEGMIWFLVQTFEDDDLSYLSQIGTADGGRTLTWLPSWGYAGVHWNSTILSHAFYLAVEGGRNRTTGLTVGGVGGANRHDIERAFFRALTELMPNSPNMGMAAGTIVQSAADLFGVGSSTHRAVGQALVAVGLLRPAAN